ncbi:hypothetical protein C7974DRAFT_57357 [Boeremia exigua]|uniref:uncharacterized protein n=1 Tax=Boeremia exigua TaxID=749465 RepID=UPI001E8D9910|nr:uncharacterized protein C7974DRAFT_57357 [Boeremia exigua]KAH6615007.1 hypothetical protein C7974DRAFT_57357 [Boeremia exigua]
MPSTVVIPSSSRRTRRVVVDKVHSVICNRVKDGDEQYLVRWQTEESTLNPPLSWHPIQELQHCLEHVQDYLEKREKSKDSSLGFKVLSKKRKSPDAGVEIERRPSPHDRRLQQDTVMPSTSRSSSASSSRPPPQALSYDVYNGILDADEHGFMFCRSASGPNIASISVPDILTFDMKHTAHQSGVETAYLLIRAAYVRRLEKVPGARIELFNTVDATTPSLRFRYIPHYVLTKGVYQFDPATTTGCQRCSPHMGQGIGCEYTKRCDCLEYAAVDEARLNNEQRQEYEQCKEKNLSTIGLPKKFPYYTKGTKVQRTGALVSFYLDSRRPIYECNDNCRCGPKCRNRMVQFGRKVEVQIFKTPSGRGWGLCCKEDLHQGQFIDTYRGEVITDEEATRREDTSSKAKASYLYNLDKFAETEVLDHEPYVVDGEFMGGPSKFMNHSCQPNCRQYTVSYNKHDPYIYDIAFFACRDIPAMEELTFDYLDKEEGDEMDDPGEGAIPCLCGAPKCRKWLWT